MSQIKPTPQDCISKKQDKHSSYKHRYIISFPYWGCDIRLLFNLLFNFAGRLHIDRFCVSIDMLLLEIYTRITSVNFYISVGAVSADDMPELRRFHKVCSNWCGRYVTSSRRAVCIVAYVICPVFQQGL